MAEEKKSNPSFLEDAVHVLINEVSPNIVNGILEHLPRDAYEKLIQNSSWIQKIEPIVSTLLLRLTNNAMWADSLTATILARLREEIGKRAKGEHTTTTSTKEKKEKVVAGNTIRTLLLSAEKVNVNEFLSRVASLPKEKKSRLLDVAVDKASNVIVNLATCDEALFSSFVDLLIGPEEVLEPLQPSFIEEVIACPCFVAYFSSLSKENKIAIKRHIEHIPEGRRKERLLSLNSGTPDEFLTYVNTVLLAKEYYDLDKLLPSFWCNITDFFSGIHEKRKRQGGLLASFNRGRESYRNRRRG